MSTSILDLRAAQLAVQAALAHVHSFTSATTLSIKQGRLLTDLSTRTQEASEYLSKLADETKDAKTLGDLPLDAALLLCARALGSLAAGADACAEWERRNGVTSTLMTGYEAAVGQASSALQQVQARLEAARTGAGTAVVEASTRVTDMAYNLPLMHEAHDALQALTKRLADGAADAQHAYLAPIRDLMTAATAEVTASVARLTHPPESEANRSVVVAAATEALTLARSALGFVTATLAAHAASAPAAVTTPIVTQLESARSTAQVTVAAALSYLASLRANVASTAAAAAQTGVTLAVSQAAAVEVAYHVRDKLHALVQAYGLDSLAAAAARDATAVAVRVDDTYHVRDKAAAAIARVSDVDARVTGGQGARVAAYALAAGHAGLELARDVHAQFEAAVVARTGPVPVEGQASAVPPRGGDEPAPAAESAAAHTDARKHDVVVQEATVSASVPVGVHEDEEPEVQLVASAFHHVVEAANVVDGTYVMEEVSTTADDEEHDVAGGEPGEQEAHAGEPEGGEHAAASAGGGGGGSSGHTSGKRHKKRGGVKH